MKIFYKLIFSYFFTAIIPIIIIGTLSFNVAVSNIKTQSIDNLSQLQEKYVLNIVNNLSKFQLLCDNIYYDQQLQNFMLGSLFNVNPNYYEEQYIFINDYLKPKLQASFPVIDSSLNLSIIRYNNNPIEIISSDYDNVLNIRKSFPTDYLEKGIKRQSYQIYNIERVQNKEWFNTVYEKSDAYRWIQLIDDQKYKNISLVREMSDFSDPGAKKIGLLKLTVRLEDVLGEEDPYNAEKGFSLFFDENNRLLSPESEKEEYYNKNKDFLLHSISSKSVHKEVLSGDVIILGTVMNSTGWKMISIYPLNELKSSARKITIIVLIACLVSLVILFLITYKVSSVFSGRITNIYKYMTMFQNENINFSSRLTDIHQDELGFLARTFNIMADRITVLIKDVYQANIVKKQSELKALQAQINPHFLYNSLSAVSRLALLGDSSKIENLVQCLVKFYRMTLNNGRNLISISGELEQVKAYLEIYSIRKRNFFNVHYDIDINILEYLTIKVILQPFVENIFEHAVYNRNCPINIVIFAAKSGNNIVFKIIDDGVGMRKEKAESLTINENSQSYGIKNVNERIQLQYGNEYGVEIFSRLGTGTAVTITIPAEK